MQDLFLKQLNAKLGCRMVLETRQQSMAWMEHVFQISLKNFAHLMEDKMLPGALGCTPHSEIRRRKGDQEERS